MKEGPTSMSGKKMMPLYERIRQILESARSSVARMVNTTQVVANWLIGREIVEEEQGGHNRAEYGHQLIEQLSEKLKADFGGGYSTQNLFYMRQFYSAYPSLIPSSEILHALRGKSNAPDIPDAPRRKFPSEKTLSESLIGHALRSESWQPGQLHPNLSWTHYRKINSNTESSRIAQPMQLRSRPLYQRLKDCYREGADGEKISWGTKSRLRANPLSNRGRKDAS